MQTEKATYDPDLPHAWMRNASAPHECALCGRPPKEDIHTVAPIVQHASAADWVETEKGS